MSAYHPAAGRVWTCFPIRLDIRCLLSLPCLRAQGPRAPTLPSLSGACSLYSAVSTDRWSFFRATLRLQRQRYPPWSSQHTLHTDSHAGASAPAA